MGPGKCTQGKPQHNAPHYGNAYEPPQPYNQKHKEVEIEHNEAVAAENSNSSLNEVVFKALSGASSLLYTDIGFHLSCIDLPNTDASSKTDPYCAAYMKDKSNNWILLGMTEVVQNSISPSFVALIKAKFFFEEKQFIKIDVYDQDNEDLKQFSKQDYIGSVEFVLSSLVVAKEKTFDITGGLAKGKVKVCCEVLKGNRTNAYFNIQLPEQSTFITINKMGTSKITVYKSEVTKTANYSLKEARINASLLCDDNYNQQIIFEIYQYDPKGNHIKRGEYSITLNQLIEKPKIAINGKRITQVWLYLFQLKY